MSTATLTAAELDELIEDRDRLTVRLNKIINVLADRDDLLLRCVWTRDQSQPDAPAWFIPSTGWVTIDATFALQGEHPSDVNPLTKVGRRKHPVLVGLCCHEASHAHSTQWPTKWPQGTSPGVRQAATLLEEPRIEGRQVQRRPADAAYLRAQSVLIDLKQFADGQTPELDRWRAAGAALMTLARFDAGVLLEEDVEHIRPIIQERLGEDYETLESLWREALGLEDGDLDGMIATAQRWVDVLGEPPAQALAMPGCAAEVNEQEVPEDEEWESDQAGGGSGDDKTEDDGDGSGGGDSGGDPGDGEGSGGALAEAMAEALMAAAASVAEEMDAENAASEAAQAAANAKVEEANQAAVDTKVQKQAQKTADEVFSEGKARPGRTRPPTTAERVLARQIGEVLKKARFQERSFSTTRSEQPPGRFISREAVTRKAQRSMRTPTTAKPFVAKKYRHAPEPPISLGIMVDKSGSMGWASELMPTLAWAFAHAMGGIRGTCATVAYDARVMPITHPGEHPDKVSVFAADGGTENFRAAFAALDGALNLTRGRGVRLLVVVSDGHYVPDQSKAANEAVQRMTRNGGHVLWLSALGASNGNIPAEASLSLISLAERAPEGLPAGAIEVPRAMTQALTAALKR